MNLFIFIATFFFMEGVAWFTHKYIMHGFLWVLHDDHHTHTNPGFFEKNDAFFLIFAVPGATLMYLGMSDIWAIGLPIGWGITAYGLCYFLVHDVFIHQRFKWLRNSNNVYFRALRRAHKIHHKHMGKEDGECFGMLLVPWKYFKTELARKK